jgi:DNA repair exonuclease SbcCD ATPase subunit
MSVADYIVHRNEHLQVAVQKLEDAKVVTKRKIAELLAARAKATTCLAAIPDVTALSRERATCDSSVTRYATAKQAVKLTKSDLEAAKTQLVLRETELNPVAETVKLCQTRLKEIELRLAENQKKSIKLHYDQDVAAAVVKVFGPAGVRAQILDTVTPFLNERTEDYLSVLTDGNAHATWTTLTKSASGDLKEKFSIDVCHDKGGDSFKAISGGEKRKVRIATALALQDLVASRATQPIDLFIGDEVDDALDPAGLERLMVILERRARERGTVIVISHSDLRDWIDDVTIVRKSAQWFSAVEGSLTC